MTKPTAELTKSAIIAAVPAADPLVHRHRAHLDPSATLGVLAHVTVLVPFLPPRLINSNVITRVSVIAARLPAETVTFGRVAWFGTHVAYIAPEPADWFRRATTAMHEEFPDCLPYAGQFNEVVPHLTVAADAGVRDMQAAVDDVQQGLPITVRIERLLIIAGNDEPNSWRTLAELCLGARGACEGQARN